MENGDFAGYVLGVVPGFFTEERIKKWQRAVLMAQKQRDAKIKKAKVPNQNRSLFVVVLTPPEPEKAKGIISPTSLI